MKYDVFISYSHHDQAIADAICSGLEKKDVSCWYAPRNIRPGEEWESAIITAINSVKIMIVVFTDQSNISKQVKKEIANAVNAGKIIIPFKLTKTAPSKGLQYYLTDIQWLDATGKRLEDGISELVSFVSRMLHPAARTDSHTEEPAPDTGRTVSGPRKLFADKRIQIAFIAAVVLIILGIILFQGNSNQKLLQQIYEGKIETTKTETDAFSTKLQVRNPENSFYSDSWYDTVDADEEDTVLFKITYTNRSGQLQKDVAVRLISSDYMEYVPGTTILYNSTNEEGLAWPSDNLSLDGINIGDYQKDASAVITFEAKVKTDLPRGGANVLREWVQIYVGENCVQDYADVHIKKE